MRIESLEKPSEDRLRFLINYLRCNGDTNVCLLCPRGQSCPCQYKGLSIVNLIISSHIPLAVNLASKFRSHRDICELVSVALLSLVEAVNNYPALFNDNMIAYVSSRITWGIKGYLKKAHLVPVEKNTFKKTKESFKVLPLDANLKMASEMKVSRHELQVQVREVLAGSTVTETDKVVAKCMLNGNYTQTEMANMCGVSNMTVTRSVQRITENFRRKWASGQ